MPIRFRCPGCEGLLSIATRKAGNEIGCPKCGELLIVPPPVESSEPEPPAEPEPTPPPKPQRRLKVEAAGVGKGAALKEAPLFENPDFDRILGEVEAPPKPVAKTVVEAEVVPARPVVETGFLVSRGTAAVLAVLTLLLVVLSFAAGFLVGKG